MQEQFDLRRLKILVNSPEVWKVLDTYLNVCYNTTNDTLDSSKDIVSIHQLQGERKFIKKLLKLKEVVNNAEQT